MASVCLPSDALLQHLPSYLGFSYLGCGVSLHGCCSKAQPLLLTLDEGYFLTATLPDLQCGIAPLGPPMPAQPWLLGLLLSAPAPDFRHGVAPLLALSLSVLVFVFIIPFYPNKHVYPPPSEGIHEHRHVLSSSVAFILISLIAKIAT